MADPLKEESFEHLLESASEPEEEDDEDQDERLIEAAPKRKRKSRKVEPQYSLGASLRAPRTTTYSCEHLRSSWHCGDIDNEADYQRSVVWTTDKMSALIDSIFHEYYVPPILFSVVRNDVSCKGTRTSARVWQSGTQTLTLRDSLHLCAVHTAPPCCTVSSGW